MRGSKSFWRYQHPSGHFRLRQKSKYPIHFSWFSAASPGLRPPVPRTFCFSGGRDWFFLPFFFLYPGDQSPKLHPHRCPPIPDPRTPPWPRHPESRTSPPRVQNPTPRTPEPHSSNIYWKGLIPEVGVGYGNCPPPLIKKIEGFIKFNNISLWWGV